MFCTVFIVYGEDYATTNVTPEIKVNRTKENCAFIKCENIFCKNSIYLLQYFRMNTF